MTVLTNQIHIDAPRDRVWAILSDLAALERHDPGVTQVTLIGEHTEGIGAQRRCDLSPRGWFIEEVAVWEPPTRLAFILTQCSLPVRALRHDYRLTETTGRTLVEQTMTYHLKYGPLGSALDTEADPATGTSDPVRPSSRAWPPAWDCPPNGVSGLTRRLSWRGRSCDDREDHKRELDAEEGEEDDLAQRGRAGCGPGAGQSRPGPW